MAKEPNSAGQGTLLEHHLRKADPTSVPLAERLRPTTLDDIVGQTSALGPGSFLRRAIEDDRLPSLILWGPPGVGKTTLAQVIARMTKRNFVPLSAVLAGVSELRVVITQATEERKFRGKATILFVDEIHRFNKAQQDAFLPYVENGTITLIGATTENPSFALNRAVLSRTKVVRLEPLSEAELQALLERSLRRLGTEAERPWSADALLSLAKSADGDARRALNLLEVAILFTRGQEGPVETEEVREVLSRNALAYDKGGDEHYNLASALIKSLRGSDPDAALYYLLRLLDAGADPAFLSRRMVIFASEDVGNADPRALTVALQADDAFRRIGMPEGVYPLSHACLFLASCPKSGAVKQAIGRVRQAIAETGSLPPPKHIRNAPTELMRDQGYGEGYQYPHDFPEGFAPGETYLPEDLLGSRFYTPTEHGLEKAIGERLDRILAARKRP